MVSADAASDAERPVIENLMQLYHYDWSELVPLDVTADGRFEHRSLAEYWSVDWRHPFLIRSDGKLAGFALISARSQLSGSVGVYDVTEFFVLRRYRRNRVGSAAANALFERFAGPWEIRQRDENPGGTAFWRNVVARHTGGAYEESRWQKDGAAGVVQRFSAPSA